MIIISINQINILTSNSSDYMKYLAAYCTLYIHVVCKFIYFKLHVYVTLTRALIQEDRVLKRKQEEALCLSVS